MSTDEDGGGAVRFDGWTLRPAQRQLVMQGVRVPIGGRAFDVLRVLVQRRGGVVTKDELLAAAWPGVVVEENNISVQIAALRKLLGAQVITTVAGRGYQLGVPALEDRSAGAAPGPAPMPAGEPAGELLGRQDDLRALLDRLADLPLVTLTGPGGVGKTALAREAFARRCALLQRPGVWIDFAPVRTPDRVASTLARALGVDLGGAGDDLPTAAQVLAAALALTEGLVVLDNAEHLQPALAPLVRRALADAPGLRWLVTSQLPLQVPGESVYRLDPLSVPDAAGPLTPTRVIEHGAVALLCKRVADADRRFRLSEHNVAAVVALCERLDGLPLAIEMAAARVATIGIDAVQGLLGQRLKLAAVAGREVTHRHASLRDTYAWSCSLLSATEQAVFRRLEPFLGGFGADLAQQVACDDDIGGDIGAWEVMEALASLVDKSLVHRGSDGAGRFFLLESARDHARACLLEAGELQRVQRRHARAVARRLASAQDDASVMHDAAWIERHGPEQHNARAALAHCAAHAPEDGLADDLARLVTALALMDWMQCRQADILQADVPLPLLAQAAPRLRAAAWLELSWALFSDGDHRLGAELAHQAQLLFESLGEAALAYRALAQHTRLLESLPDSADAAARAWAALQARQAQPMPRRIRLFCAVSGGLVNRADAGPERLEALGREAEHEGFDGIAAIAACNRTDSLLVAGRLAEVVSATERAVARHGRAHRACACMLLNQTTALVRLGRHADAQQAAQRALRLMPAVAPSLVDAFALAAARDGRLADAAVLHGCGEQIRAALSHAPDRAEAASIAETAERLQAGLAAAQLAELMALGAAMRADEALAIKVFPRRPPAMAWPAAAAAGPASSGDLLPAS